jgi:Predicted membrane protein
MISEAILSYLHLSAILAMVVFITSEGAICRPEWFNAAVLKRMLRVDLIYMICGAAVAITGVTRIILGAKGTDWYIAQPMLHAKVLLFLIVGIYSVRVSIALQKWQGRFEDENGALPDEAEIRRVRRMILIEAHLIMIIPLFAVLFARGIFGAA